MPTMITGKKGGNKITCKALSYQVLPSVTRRDVDSGSISWAKASPFNDRYSTGCKLDIKRTDGALPDKRGPRIAAVRVEADGRSPLQEQQHQSESAVNAPNATKTEPLVWHQYGASRPRNIKY